jgi:hypothetical protein
MAVAQKLSVRGKLVAGPRNLNIAIEEELKSLPASEVLGR